jgi:hypothetical protein
MFVVFYAGIVLRGYVRAECGSNIKKVKRRKITMMKKKGFILAIVSVALVALTGAAVAFAWLGNLKTGTNTVKIGQPLQISIDDGVFDRDNLMPGETASATFDIDLTGADFEENTYAIKIVGAAFTKPWTYGDSVAVWQYQFASAGYADLTAAGGSVALTAETESVTLTLKLDGSVPTSVAGGELTFILEIEATEIPD